MSRNKQIVYITDVAKKDMRAIATYILKADGKENTFIVLKSLKKQLKKIENLPLRGRIVPEFKHIGIQKYHEVIYTPWRIIFEVIDNNIFIVSILDSRRDLEDILFQRLIQNRD